MNDQLLMNNYLLILKSTVEVYVHGTLESSNEDVKSLLNQGLNETILHQAKTYAEMTKYGWYTINNIESATINQTLTKLKEQN